MPFSDSVSGAGRDSREFGYGRGLYTKSKLWLLLSSWTETSQKFALLHGLAMKAATKKESRG